MEGMKTILEHTLVRLEDTQKNLEHVTKRYNEAASESAILQAKMEKMEEMIRSLHKMVTSGWEDILSGELDDEREYLVDLLKNTKEDLEAVLS
jgi:hypothetical protein